MNTKRSLARVAHIMLCCLGVLCGTCTLMSVNFLFFLTLHVHIAEPQFTADSHVQV